MFLLETIGFTDPVFTTLAYVMVVSPQNVKISLKVEEYNNLDLVDIIIDERKK